MKAESHLKIAKLLIIIPTIWYSIIPPIVDFTLTHVFNPAWVGHARFHTVWLLTTNTLIGIIALVFLFRKIPTQILGMRIAGLLSLCVYAGFFGAALSMGAYDGTLSDSDVVPKILGIDGNLFAFTPLTIMLITGTYMSFKQANH